MSSPVGNPISSGNVGRTFYDTTRNVQHVRSNSMQSTTSTATLGRDDGPVRKELPDIVRRDMEFFMARLARSSSHGSS
ncbi:hypothetical protein B0H67DRAFT_579477 [Lasiosphaeris hirsuta]|uniref:Uncharacterized protein n=1 Tax=Lasiosphaeris hirsuta TaxID=260670 RepID=A0AA40AFL0_9PEZI|nr:hypothetical protein B0H67DRAFT_579477 [Lasiosphaeris hirsuta]